MAQIANHPLRIRRGDTFRRTLQLWADETQTLPIDLSSKTITGHARKSPDDSKWFDLNITITDPSNGVFEIHHTDQETQALSTVELTGNYDIQMADQVTGDVVTFLTGTMTVTKDYTY